MAIPQKQIVRISKRLIRRPSLYIIITLIIVLAVQWQSHHNHPHVFSSATVHVIDGDTIVLKGLKIRLQGIDALESKPKLCTQSRWRNMAMWVSGDRKARCFNW